MPFDVRIRRSGGSIGPAVPGRGWFATWFVPDAGDVQDNFAILAPVAFGAGAAIYIAHGPDDHAIGSAGVAGLLLILALVIRRTVAFPLPVLLAILLLGFSWTAWRIGERQTPMLDRSLPPGEVVGRLITLDPAGVPLARWLIQPEWIERLGDDPLPGKIRVTIPAPEGIARAGDRIRIRAVLYPVPGAAAPGSYDPGFWSFASGVGARGRALTTPEILAGDDASLGIPQSMHFFITNMRLSVAGRIGDRIAGPAGGLAIALLTGLRGGLDPTIREHLRAAGIAHILAISGLHMAIVAGGAFWLTRFVFAGAGGTYLRVRAKMLAAIAALVITSGYLVMSGAAVASQRAYVMLAIMFLAVVIARPALTLRNVAIAAWVVLLIQPHAVVSPGFQMSFAATIALVIGYRSFAAGALARRRKEIESVSLRLVRSLAVGFAGLAFTALIAGTATAPFAGFHFNRLAVFGLLANILAMPVVTFCVMPAGFTALVGMPLGLEAVPLAMMETGIAYIVAVAGWVAGLPGAVTIVPAMPGFLIASLSIAALLTLARVPAGLAVVPLVAGLLMFARSTPPDIMINATGSSIGVRSMPGHLVMLHNRGGRIVRDVWLRRLGQAPPDDTAELRRGRRCDAFGCTVPIWRNDAPISVAYSTRPEGLTHDCRRSAIVISSYPVNPILRDACALAHDGTVLLVDQTEINQHGAMELRVLDNEIAVRATRAPEAPRPWQGRLNDRSP